MDNYEYLVTECPQNIYTGLEMSEWLNDLGKKGWRVLRIPEEFPGWFYFERAMGMRLGDDG